MFNKNLLCWLFFDIGETLVDESKPIRDVMEQFKQAADLLGYTFTLENVEQLMLYYGSKPK